MGIFLISLGNGVKWYLFFPKRAKANFVHGPSLGNPGQAGGGDVI